MCGYIGRKLKLTLTFDVNLVCRNLKFMAIFKHFSEEEVGCIVMFQTYFVEIILVASDILEFGKKILTLVSHICFSVGTIHFFSTDH